jgi:hypothetical protein
LVGVILQEIVIEGICFYKNSTTNIYLLLN